MRRKDYGTKVAGAKKDLWKERNLMLEDLADMNGLEMDKNINKNNIWKKPDYMQYRETGIPVEVVYFYKQVRDSLPPKPPVMHRMETTDMQLEVDKQQKLYLEFISEIRDLTLQCQTIEDIKMFYEKNVAHSKYFYYKRGYSRPYLVNDYAGIFTNKFNKACQVTDITMQKYRQDIYRKQFCFDDTDKLIAKFNFLPIYKDSLKKTADGTFTYTQRHGGIHVTVELPKEIDGDSIENDCMLIFDKKNKFLYKAETRVEAVKYILNNYSLDYDAGENKKEKKQRKERFLPEQFKKLERVGPNYRAGMNVKEDEFKKTFDTPWVEFGEYLSDAETVQSANYCYDALLDMCRALNMSPEDASLGGRLSLGFGTRGSGIATAHYEYTNEIINITKKRGPGALGHEFGHAIDDICAKKMMLPGTMTSWYWRKNSLPEMKILIESLKTQNGKVTEFYKGSRFFGGKYTSSGHEYWTSNSEMFARAFHCYLEDKVAEMNKKDGKEGRNDYLCGHASGYVTTGLDGTYYRAFPIGEERKIINQNFDNLFEKLRDKGLIHQWTPEMEKKYIQPNVLDYIKESQKTEIEKAFSQNNSNTKIETKPILKNSLAGENPEGIKKFLNRANKEQTKYVNIASKLLSNNDDASLMFDFSDDVHLGRLTSKLVEYKDTEFVKKLSDVVYEDDLLKLKNIVPDNEVLREYVDATIETLEKRRKNDVDIVSGANGQQTLNFDTTTNNKAISNQDSLNNQNNQNIQNNQENVRYSSTKRKDGNDQIQFDI